MIRTATLELSSSLGVKEDHSHSILDLMELSAGGCYHLYWKNTEV